MLILSASSLVRSPESWKERTNSLASLVETLEAFAMTVARNEDALAGSMDDESRIWFMSYLKGLMRCVFSIDCLFVDSLVLWGLFFFPLSYWLLAWVRFTTTLFLYPPSVV